MPYNVDVWCGDLHTEHFGSKSCETWQEAADFMGPLIDTGLLCNVLHSDFRAPARRIAEMEAELAKYLHKGE